MSVEKSKLDAWITGNYGEGHPANRELHLQCESCRQANIVAADMREQCWELAICEQCYRKGERICTWCLSPHDIDSMWACDTSSRASEGYELFCEICAESYRDDHGMGMDAFEAEHIEARSAEARMDSRGKNLPERLYQVCRAWEWRFLPPVKAESMSRAERESYLRSEAGKLCELFADTGIEGLSGFHSAVFIAAMRGEFRKVWKREARIWKISPCQDQSESQKGES